MAIIANQDIQSKAELRKGRQHFLDQEDIISILQIYFKVFQEGFPTAPTRSGRDMWVLYIVFMFYNDLLGVAKMSQYQLCCDIENL